MIQKELYTHFHPDEHHFVDRAWEWVERSAEQHAVKRTDFLDPRQTFILTTLVNRHPDVHCRLEGGYPDAERKRAVIAPDYRHLDDEEMNISVLAISSGDGKFLTLEHGDYMGAILGLGMKRDKIGDIHVIEGGCHCLVADEAASYLHMNLSQVHRVHVQTELLSLDKLQVASTRLEELHLSVASMRMDGIVSDVFRLSRAKVLIPIQAGRCRVNWKTEEDPSKPLKEGDMISLQGFGRFKVLEVEGVTKKGRIRVIIGRYA
ncbi:YlmH family RNA-binding protein [Paenibacillus hexagrammi]|uniref:YlmH/Sll1252 family protein n=1 Tax=Paenibacillus hexagrammi TaxID=2908839 RepID=A0ABY3SN54_9BACL|nr:YlmH/Sll1252 family protein [Paenibacillus sp. YPD9-1]UJF35149.1 YlmH/Sll1252 family protein [Paenibacillus sp. YPD9-1]